MNRFLLRFGGVVMLVCGLAGAPTVGQQLAKPEQNWPAPTEGDYLVHDFRFQLRGAAVREVDHSARHVRRPPARDRWKFRRRKANGCPS